MSDHLNLETLDPSGDLREQAHGVAAFEAPMDRRVALRRGAAAGGGLLIAGGLFQTMLSPAEAAISKGRKSKKNDIAILNYALTLEWLESTFYAQAIANKAYAAGSEMERFALITGGHEATHVTALQKTIKSLGGKPVKSPMFNFGAAVTDPKTFAATAQVLEDTGVSAYAGQVGNVLQKPVLAAAAAIHSVEARHAAWIRFLNGGGGVGAAESAAPAPAAFDAAKTEKQVLKAVGATGFITG